MPTAKDPLSDIPTHELRRVLEERERAEAQERAAAAAKRRRAIASALTRELIDALAPAHGRTSCSDERLSNGFYPGAPVRCSRCGLLEALSDRDIPEGLRLVVHFERE